LTHQVGLAQNWTETLDLGHFSDGIYFVRIETAQETLVRKIVLEKTD
jgi:hypothetical protein